MSKQANTTESPFEPTREDAYARWKEAKLEGYPARIEDLIVEVGDPRHLTATEVDAIRERCRRANMAVYASRSGDDPDKDIPRLLGLQFGLARLDHNPGADEDAISSLTVQSDALHRGFIPYTNRPIAWHTDGYYNSADQQIHGMLLHCVQPAADGGENQLMDHEIAYMLLRDRDPDSVRALMHPRAMTIPANLVKDAGADAGSGLDKVEQLRPERTGPVFSLHPDGHLHMRYTDRSRSIQWREDPLTTRAVTCLKDILHTSSPWHFQAKLQAGWGLLCNNCLHTRSGFEDGNRPRLLYRARYYDRISGT